MTHLNRLVVASTLLAISPAWAQNNDDRELIAQAAANRNAANAAPAKPAHASAQADDERRARSDVALANARLELVLARRASKSGQHREAAARAIQMLAQIRDVPKDTDISEFELQAEGVLARAKKAGVDVDAMLRAAHAGGDDAPATQPQAKPPTAAPVGSNDAPEDYLDRQTRVAAEIGRGFSGADTRDIDTTGNAETLRQRTLRNQTPDDAGYRPARENFDLASIAERDRQRLAHQAALAEAYGADEVRRLVEADEARLAPDTDIAYPDNWKQRVARRSKYAGGEIARSASWSDSAGKEWYAAVYDIRDVTYNAPDFQPAFSLDLNEDLRNVQDRAALRDRSWIFGGTAEELALGIPLLRFFGGVDDYAFRGPKFSREKAAQIVEQIKAFTTQTNESRVSVQMP